MAEFSSEFLDNLLKEMVDDGVIPNTAEMLKSGKKTLREMVKQGGLPFVERIQEAGEEGAKVRRGFKLITEAALDPTKGKEVTAAIGSLTEQVLAADFEDEILRFEGEVPKKPKPKRDLFAGASARERMERGIGQQQRMPRRFTGSGRGAVDLPFDARRLGGLAELGDLDAYRGLLGGADPLRGIGPADDLIFNLEKMVGDTSAAYTSPIGPNPRRGFFGSVPEGTLGPSEAIKYGPPPTEAAPAPKSLGRSLRGRLGKDGVGGLLSKVKPAKLSGVGRVLGPIGAALFLYDIMSNFAEGNKAPARYRQQALSGSGDELMRLLQPSAGTAFNESRALRDISEASGRGMPAMPSQELMTLIEGKEKTLADLRQKVNPTMTEAYARAGLL